MSIKYGSLNVDERYSGILEPNLYYNPVLVPGVTGSHAPGRAPLQRIEQRIGRAGVETAQAAVAGQQAQVGDTADVQHYPALSRVCQ